MWECKKCGGVTFEQEIRDTTIYKGCDFSEDSLVKMWYNNKSDFIESFVTCSNCKSKGENIGDIATWRNDGEKKL